MDSDKSIYYSYQRPKHNYHEVHQFVEENIDWFTGKMGIYFASGDYLEEYHRAPEQLNFDKLVLVDYCFNQCKLIDNIAIIPSESCSAIRVFKDLGIKFSAFISLNDGLNEGGGFYSHHSNYFLSYALQILSDPHLHVYSWDYFRNTNNKKIADIDHHITDITLDPSIERLLRYKVQNLNIYKLKKRKTLKMIYQNGKATINIINQSIWNDADKLDRIYVKSRDYLYRFTSNHKTEMISKGNCISRNNESLHIFINDCMKYKDKIGTMPFGYDNYKEFLNNIRSIDCNVNLYHLNKNDYRIIKERSELVNIIDYKGG